MLALSVFMLRVSELSMACFPRLFQTAATELNGEKVRKAAQGHEDEAGKIEKALEHFTELVGTYNALATAYAGIYDDLHVFFDELVYADHSARKRAERSGA